MDSCDTNTQFVVIQPCKTRQKKYRRSYAAVVTQERVKRPSGKKVKSNRLAYTAWQERHKTQEIEKGSLTIPQRP